MPPSEYQRKYHLTPHHNSTKTQILPDKEDKTVNYYNKRKWFRLIITLKFPCAVILDFMTSLPCPIVSKT